MSSIEMALRQGCIEDRERRGGRSNTAVRRAVKGLLAFAILVAIALGLPRIAQAQATCAAPGPNCCRALDTCHVSTTGTDGAQGTSANPWRTLQYAVDAIEPGDTILVKAGTYAGFRIRSSGASTGRKTIMAECPAIEPDCAGQVSQITSAGPLARHDSFVEVERNVADDPANVIIQYWTLDGFRVSGSLRYGIDLRYTKSIFLFNSVIWRSALAGIFVAHGDDALVENNESHHNGEHGIYVSDSSHLPVIRLNHLHHNDDSGVHMNGGFTFGPRGRDHPQPAD